MTAHPAEPNVQTILYLPKSIHLSWAGTLEHKIIELQCRSGGRGSVRTFLGGLSARGRNRSARFRRTHVVLAESDAGGYVFALELGCLAHRRSQPGSHPRRLLPRKGESRLQADPARPLRRLRALVSEPGGTRS